MVPILASSNVNWRRLLGCVGREVLLSDMPFLRSRAMFAPGTNLRCLDSGLENGPVAAVVGGVETELVCSDALPVTTALVGGIFRGIEDMLPSVLVIDEPTTLACWPRIFTSFIVPAVAEHLARSELRLTTDCEGADCCSPSDAVRCEFQVKKAGAPRTPTATALRQPPPDVGAGKPPVETAQDLDPAHPPGRGP